MQIIDLTVCAHYPSLQRFWAHHITHCHFSYTDLDREAKFILENAQCTSYEQRS